MTESHQTGENQTGENQTGTGPTRTIAWFHCFAGIAGDMALGSLIDAGADVDALRTLLARLALPGWELQIEETLRGGVACTRALVRGGDDVGGEGGIFEEFGDVGAVHDKRLSLLRRLAGGTARPTTA